MANTKTRALKGYQARDSVSHRPYSFKSSVKRYAKTGGFTYRGTKVRGKIIYGLGHKAGEDWAERKQIDPESRVRKYSKNSPSFDEGVYKYKNESKSRALSNKMLDEYTKRYG